MIILFYLIFSYANVSGYGAWLPNCFSKNDCEIEGVVLNTINIDIDINPIQYGGGRQKVCFPLIVYIT